MLPPLDVPVLPPLDVPVLPPLDGPVFPPLDVPVLPPLDAPVLPPLGELIEPPVFVRSAIELPLLQPQRVIATISVSFFMCPSYLHGLAGRQQLKIKRVSNLKL